MKKPFFYKIVSADLLNFATDLDGQNVTLLKFAKDLQNGRSDIPFIQSIINEANEYRELKAESGKKGGLAKASGAKAVLKQNVAVLKQNVAHPYPETETETETETKENPLAAVALNVPSQIKTTTTATAKIFAECFTQHEIRIKQLYPHADFEAERETCIAHYRQGAPPIDCYPVILKWFQRVKKPDQSNKSSPKSYAEKWRDTAKIEMNAFIYGDDYDDTDNSNSDIKKTIRHSNGAALQGAHPATG